LTGVETSDWLAVNQENWDARVAVHAASDFYDLRGFRAGACTLRPFELDEVGAVTGRRLVHLQCHMGQDTLSWARRGARVTGLDFSSAAIDVARVLADDLDLRDQSRFVVADVYQAASALGERFDIVYTGLGALVWLPDLDRWARVVTSLLEDGGLLYLAEFHPVTDVLDDDGRAVEHDYFDTAPVAYECGDTYTDGPELTHRTSVQFHHTLADVITAIARAGLRIEFLHEHPTTLFRRYAGLEAVDQGYRFPAGRPRIPMMYSLRAVKI
jgi:SAM-dependent methyltransferase